MKAVVAAFNQEKALVGAFSVITNLRMELFEALYLTISMHHLALLLLLLCVRGGAEAARQSVQCYDGYDQQGSEVRATEYMPSLAYHSFDNRIKSCCFTGTDLVNIQGVGIVKC